MLTGITYPTYSLKLVQTTTGSKRSQLLLALQDGTFEITAHYQVQVARRDNERGFTMPVHYGLVNEMKLTVIGSDVDVVSPAAVSVKREAAGTNTVASVVLAPAREVLFTPGAVEAARAAVRELAERVDRPTSKVREVLDPIEARPAFFRMEALLPGFHPGGLAPASRTGCASTWPTCASRAR